MQKLKGTLFICATPIGNLSDASFRLINKLKDAEIILAEDTRTLKKLLLKYDIKKQKNSILSFQDYSSRNKINSILEKLKSGADVALVSESGTPAIQDPGFKLIRECIDSGINISSVPGPNAAINALVSSGLSTDSFLFIGFLPKKSSKISAKLKSLQYLPFTLIFYESPLRIIKLLSILNDLFGDRKCCLAREMTKIYEETIRGSISEVKNELLKRESLGIKLKGEIVIVVEGYNQETVKNYNKADIINEFKKLISLNIQRKEAIKILRSKYEIDRNQLYNLIIKVK